MTMMRGKMKTLHFVHLCLEIIESNDLLTLVFYMCKLNISILREDGLEFFIGLEDPHVWMIGAHIDACINILCKRCRGPDNKSFKHNVGIVDTTFYVSILSCFSIMQMCCVGYYMVFNNSKYN